MKKILTLFVYLILGQYCFGQWSCQIPIKDYKIGDTVLIEITPTGSPNKDVWVNIKIYNATDTLKQVYLESIRFGDLESHGSTFKFIVPDSIYIPFNSSRVTYNVSINNGQEGFFQISRILSITNPVLPENKDTEFDFYSQSGIFQKHCKVSELNPGIYIANGFKIAKQ